MKQCCFCLLLLAVMLTGCAKKDYLYLADMSEDMGYVVTNRHQTSIQDDDRLRIKVSCKNPELAAPFNVSSASVSVGSDGTVTKSSADDNVYRVNAEGDINFPVLGKLHLAGLSLISAADLIRQRIVDGNYIKDPIVSIDFVNFHYTVLGAVGGNGTYRAESDKVTILEAIAKAGDLSENADMERIAVIREQDGKRQVYNLDIRKSDIFNSPAFYLAQNDIIYARPRKPKSGARTEALSWVTVALSAVTAATSIIWATKK